jgi:hypothetical protein
MICSTRWSIDLIDSLSMYLSISIGRSVRWYIWGRDGG